MNHAYQEQEKQNKKEVILLLTISVFFVCSLMFIGYSDEKRAKEYNIQKFEERMEKNKILNNKLNTWNDFKNNNCNYEGKVYTKEVVGYTYSYNVEADVYKCNNEKEYKVKGNLDESINKNQLTEDFIPKIN